MGAVKGLLAVFFCILSCSTAAENGACEDKHPVVCEKYWIDRCGSPSVAKKYCRYTCNKERCDARGEVGTPLNRTSLEAAVKTSFKEDSTSFAVESYKVALGLQEKRENLIFSPVSISIALGMLLQGARGASRDQIKAKIAASVPQDQISAAYSWLMQELNKEGKKYQLHSANALFIQDGAELLPEFVSQVTNQFQGQAQLKDFKSQAEKARGDINAWVEGKTNNRIKDLLPAGSVDPLTLLVLVNAIYFKADWLRPFTNGARTYDSPFFALGSNSPKNVPMMEKTANFLYHEEKDLQVVGLPYEQEELTMFILLPREMDGLPDLEKTLTSQRLQSLADSTKPGRVQLTMPKFNLTKDLPLKKLLIEMGITDIFGGSSDLSGINGKKNLFVSGAFHKAFIEVNEQGTEAAAATGIVVRFRSAFSGSIFRANRPFLFFIRHSASNAILFLGSIVDL